MHADSETFESFLETPAAEPRYVVVHPLHDAPEAKRSLDGLGPLRLSPACRVALVALRVYLVAMMLLGVWRVAVLAAAMRR